MKLELLVIPDQHAGVNTFPGLVHTARHTTKVGNTRSRWPNRKEGAVEGGVGDWGEVVTRWPYRKVRPDHLLSKECLLGRSSASAGAIGTHLLVHCRVGRRSSRGRRFTSLSRRNGRRSLLFCFEGVSPSTSPSGGSSGCSARRDQTRQVNCLPPDPRGMRPLRTAEQARASLILPSYKEPTVDALAPRTDEGRGRLRKATGSCLPSVNPWMSEWGNPVLVMEYYSCLNT